jgi:hypothetical protein
MSWKRFGPQIVAQKLDDEVVVADLRTGVYHCITGAGTLMWDSIDRGYSRQQVLQMLEQAFDCTPETLHQSLTEFVDQLSADDLIKPSEGASAIAELPGAQIKTARLPFRKPLVTKCLSPDETLATQSKFDTWQPALNVVQETDDSVVTIVNAQRGVSCRLGGSGTVFWKAIEGGFTKDQIVRSLLSQFELNEETANRELEQFIARLAEFALIQPRDSDCQQETTDSSGENRLPFTAPTIELDCDKSATLRKITRYSGWQVAAPQIVSETIDDEVIAVDLQAGVYHSISGAGTLIWEGISQECSSEEIIESLLSLYDLTREQATKELDDLIEKLAEFNLIRPRPERHAQTNKLQAVPAGSKQPYAPPVLVIYKDMESVLRLDPIHDFDEYGWPSKV